LDGKLAEIGQNWLETLTQIRNIEKGQNEISYKSLGRVIIK